MAEARQQEPWDSRQPAWTLGDAHESRAIHVMSRGPCTGSDPQAGTTRDLPWLQLPADTQMAHSVGRVPWPRPVHSSSSKVSSKRHSGADMHSHPAGHSSTWTPLWFQYNAERPQQDLGELMPHRVCLHRTLSLGCDSGLSPSPISVHTQISVTRVSECLGPRYGNSSEPESCCGSGPSLVMVQCGHSSSRRPESEETWVYKAV